MATVIDSSFVDNIMGDAGALYNNGGVLSVGGDVRIIASRFSGNHGPAPWFA